MTPLEAACDYAALGFHVFPIWPIRNGKCACGTPCGRDAGKHPIGRLAPRGFQDGTTDWNIISRWWTDTPDANIGIATGAVSGVVVLDVDGDDGEASLAALARIIHEMPVAEG
jgi:putative DNA primase/helicase